MDFGVHPLAGFCKGSFPKKSLGVADPARKEEPLHGGDVVQNVTYNITVRFGHIFAKTNSQLKIDLRNHNSHFEKNQRFFSHASKCACTFRKNKFFQT